jgi:hypothetical protein
LEKNKGRKAEIFITILPHLSRTAGKLTDLQLADGSVNRMIKEDERLYF